MPAYRIYLRDGCRLNKKVVGGMTITKRPQISFVLPEGAREDPDIVVEEKKLRKKEKMDILHLYKKEE